MRTVRMVIGLFLLASTAALAEGAHYPGIVWGEGSYPIEIRLSGEEDYTLPVVLGLPDLLQYEGYAFRFSTIPSLGGDGYVVTIVQGIGDTGELRAVKVWGHPYMGWKQTATFMVKLDDKQFARAKADLAKLYDPPPIGQIDGKAPLLEDIDGKIIACGDGPISLSERIFDGEMTYLEGTCHPDHPNRRIADFMPHLLGRTFAGLWATADVTD